MESNTKSTRNIFDFLDDVPLRIIKEVNSFELIPKNSIMGVLDDNLDSDIEEWNNALPTIKITPIRGIGTQTYSADTSNIHSLTPDYMTFNKALVTDQEDGSTSGVSAMSLSDMTNIPRATVIRKCKYFL